MRSPGVVNVYRMLREKWRDPPVRRNVGYLFAAKAIGLAIVLLLMSKWYVPTSAYADAAPPLPPPRINAINTVWTLVAAYLVFCMQVGFVMLESGFARSREAVNILVEGIADTCICGVTFWLWASVSCSAPARPRSARQDSCCKGCLPLMARRECRCSPTGYSSMHSPIHAQQ